MSVEPDSGLNYYGLTATLVLFDEDDGMMIERDIAPEDFYVGHPPCDLWSDTFDRDGGPDPLISLDPALND